MKQTVDDAPNDETPTAKTCTIYTQTAGAHPILLMHMACTAIFGVHTIHGTEITFSFYLYLSLNLSTILNARMSHTQKIRYPTNNFNIILYQICTT